MDKSDEIRQHPRVTAICMLYALQFIFFNSIYETINNVENVCSYLKLKPFKYLGMGNINNTHFAGTENENLALKTKLQFQGFQGW